MNIHSFAPIEVPRARILILGSMPGVESLRKEEYYAHPRNLFWRMLGMLCEFNPALPYAERVAALGAAKISVWDVLQSCTRQGSLDADIEKSTIVPNDFNAFFRRQSTITHVFFNGSAAEKFYRSEVLPVLLSHQIQYTRLPSTSPAHASMSFEEKLAAWRAISMLTATER
jgi:hypoxanthine-DNA glycosylase